MKIELNLAVSERLDQRHLLLWAAPLLVVSVLAFGGILGSIRFDLGERKSTELSLKREEQRLNQLQQREASLRATLSRPDYVAFLRKVAFVNSVIDRRQVSVAELVAAVSALLPPEARLTALTLPDTQGTPLVRLGVESKSEKALETFLGRLEGDADFDNVAVVSEGFEQQGPAQSQIPGQVSGDQAANTVNMICTMRYLGGQRR